MTGPTATTGAGTEQTTSAKRTRILRTGRPGTGAAAAHVAALYEQHGAMVLAVCRRFLRDAAEAEDAAQQTFLSAQRALQNGSRPREPAAWLATIARNECVARTRARMREPLPTDAEPSATSLDAHTEAVRRENVESLRDAIESLPEQQREAILLREMRGLSYDEVASSLELSPAAVESLLFRARKGLQLRLRGAWAALSPVGWLASVRDLSAQVAAGGDSVAGPAAAKAVAIGLGTAVIAGGALVAPSALRHDGHHAPRHATVPKVAPVPQHSAAAPAAPVAPAEVSAATPEPTASVEKPKRAPAVSTAGSQPQSSRSPVAVQSEDGQPSHEPRSSEDAHAPPIWPTRTTERADRSSTSAESEESYPRNSQTAASTGRPSVEGDDSRRLRSETGAGSVRPPADTTAETAPTITTPPAPHESQGSDSGKDHESEGGSEGGD